MTTTIAGLAWHVHHNILMEWCYDYEERTAYIKAKKPLGEQATRLRLFQMMKGKLPAELWTAGAEYETMCAELGAVEAELEFPRAELEAARAKFWAAWAKLGAAEVKYTPQILALHAQECPDCPWNGRTIFSKGA